MLRATHFVLLFVVLACAYAAPAGDATPETVASAVPEPLGLKPSNEPLPVPEKDALPDKSDLEVAASGLKYHHYQPQHGGGGHGHGHDHGYDHGHHDHDHGHHDQHRGQHWG